MISRVISIRQGSQIILVYILQRAISTNVLFILVNTNSVDILRVRQRLLDLNWVLVLSRVLFYCLGNSLLDGNILSVSKNVWFILIINLLVISIHYKNGNDLNSR